MDLVIKQNVNQQENGNSALLDLLYNLTKPDPITGQPSVDAVLVGRITVPAAYEDAVNFLNTQFSSEQDNGSDFQVTVLNNNYYIRFADPIVEEILRNSIGKGEGEGITVAEAAAMDLGTIFRNNTDIESFDEFKYFISPNKTLSQQAFYKCSSLKRLDLSNCTSYPNDAFNGLTNLEYTVGGLDSQQGVIIIPEGTTSIGGRNNFSGCNKITSVILPDSLTYIQANNFTSMPALTEIAVGTGMTTWVRGNFHNCPNFNRVNIKDLDAWLNITFESTGEAETPLAVARHLYLNGTEVTSVDFTGKTIIKDKVLWGCLGLTSVVLTNSITSIGNSSFRSCDNLVISDLNLPNLATLGSYAFSGTKLQAISSLGSIVSLPKGCFRDCTQLANAIIPSTSSVIPKECFYNCLSITSVDLPSSVTTIEHSAFHDCRNLTTIDLTNITTLGEMAFSRCGNLSRFNGPDSAVGEIYLPNLTGNMYNAFINLSQYATSQIIYNITSLGTITEIGNWCFSTMRIETIHLPSTLKIISSNAFTNCPYVHDIYWEGTMDQWVNIDFRGVGANPCSIKSVNFYVNGTTPSSYTFPDGTTTIKPYVLNGVKGISSISMPNSVTSIGSSSFLGCSLTSLTLPNSVTIVGQNAFASCPLTSIDLGNVVTIEKGAFKDNQALTGTLIIPDSVVKIGVECFGGIRITNLEIGVGIENIGEIAFYNNPNLTTVTVKALTPPTLGSVTYPTFSRCYNLAHIYVPSQSVSVYQSASGWSTYASIIQAIQTT